jgi:hypothetical protein
VNEGLPRTAARSQRSVHHYRGRSTPVTYRCGVYGWGFTVVGVSIRGHFRVNITVPIVRMASTGRMAGHSITGYTASIAIDVQTRRLAVNFAKLPELLRKV